MRTTTRARAAFLLSLAALIAVAVFAPQLATGAPEPTEGGSEPASSGGGMAMCVEGVPDCEDMVVVPDDGTCGEVIGSGPDAAVSDACASDDRVSDGGDATLVEPTPGMADVRPHAFDRAVVGDDGRSVTVSFWSGVEPCYVLDHVDVAYAADAIAITVFEGHDPSAGDVACIEIALLKEVVVELEEPVGDREIVDGAA